MTAPCDVSVLRFDAITDALIQAVMRRMGHLAGAPDPADQVPHVSLIPTASEDREGVIDRVSALLVNQPVVEIAFSYLGLFPGGVLFLGATPTEALSTLHQQIYDVSAPGPNAPWIDLYKPGRWVPHCTVSMGMPNESLSCALTNVRNLVALPLVGTCVAIDLLEVRPGKPLRTFRKIDLLTD